MGRAVPPSGPGTTTTRSDPLRHPVRPSTGGPAGRYRRTGFARVSGMPDEYVDPSGNTEQFRAFAHSPEATVPAETASRLPLIIGAAVVGVLLVVLVAWLALG